MSTKVTLVSYINTFPYLEVLQNRDRYQLDLKVPSDCASAFESGYSDIALVPVGSLSSINRPYKRINSFGIGGDGEVRTVKLLSQQPRENISKIFLDSQSATSVQLVKILADQYWNLDIDYDAFHLGDELPESVLLIGDKVFELESQYSYSYDLSAEWKHYTGLPFAFAVWIISEDVRKKEEELFVQDLSQVSQVLDHVIESKQSDYPKYDLKSYLKKYIKYALNDDYTKAIDMFLKYQTVMTADI